MPPSNQEIALELERISDLLHAQGASPYRVRAYRRAAEHLRGMSRSAAELLEEGGEAALIEERDIGRSIAAAIAEMVWTGHIRMLDRLEGQVRPEDLLTRLPGLGPVLAQRIHDHLGIETFEALELAAHDGRLAKLPGFGEERVEALKAELSSILARRRSRGASTEARGAAPPVGVLLEVDERYRREAKAGRLHRIAPHRFNPEGSAWLPIMHTEDAGWHFHAMYSNTALAHRLARTDDWVVIYYERDGIEDQCTVVTEHVGLDDGLRVVRGREWECRRHYDEHPPALPSVRPLDWTA